MTRRVDDSDHIGQWSAYCFLQGPARHPLGHQVEKGEIPGNVRTGHGVADAVERHLGTFPFREERLFHGVSLNRVAQESHQAARVDLALDEIVLRACLERLKGQRLVIPAGQHDERHARRGCVRAPDGGDPL